MLVANPWKESAVSNITSYAGQSSTTAGTPNSCTIYTYTEKDSAYTETAVSSCTQVTVKGKWYLNKGQDSLIVVTSFSKVAKKIESLDASSLKLSTSTNMAGISYKVVTALTPYKK